MMKQTLMEARHIKKYFPIRKNIFLTQRRYIHAVDNVTFAIRKGEIIGLVGESGCGKTTIARILSCLDVPTAGELYFNEKKVKKLKGKALKDFRKNVQYIFQDPYSSLNPKKTVYDIVSTGIKAFHLLRGRRRIKDQVIAMLEMVGLSSSYLHHYPHEFSGGQRQRLSIARSLAVYPRFLICDEPVSALDVSIQAQIINLLKELQQKLDLSILFISHDLAVVKHISDRINVMYKGKIVEAASSRSLFENTSHPYTRALISAIPEPKPKAGRRRIILPGDVSAATEEIMGCCFADRCYMAVDVCFREAPLARQLVPEHTSFCHFAEKV
jgi:oligopeptide/dipeptide ABC transporter ATP-binding protein